MLSIQSAALAMRYRGPVTRAAGIRERNRAELTAAILDCAREQLVRGGATTLSLRGIARELGMASSAIYRYFPSRDALLTRLIIDAYNSLGDYVEHAEAAVDRDDRRQRFLVIGGAVRSWALAHEQEYALIYGTPVPGYAAPQDTIGPASRVTELMIRLLIENEGSSPDLPVASPVDSASVAPVMAILADQGVSISPELMIRGLMAWTLLFGAVSFELFGHVHNVVTHERAPQSPFFTAELDRMATYLGLS